MLTEEYYMVSCKTWLDIRGGTDEEKAQAMAWFDRNGILACFISRTDFNTWRAGHENARG